MKLKRYGLLLFILVCFTFKSYSQRHSIILNKIEYDSLKLHYPKQDESQEIFLIIDINDCYNCNLGLVNLTKNDRLNGKKINLYIPNVSTKKIDAFIAELGISESCIIVNSKPIKAILSRLSEYTKASKSYVVVYNHSLMLQLADLSYLSKDGNIKYFLDFRIRSENKRMINDGDVFYTSFSNGLTLSKNYVFITSPNSKLLVVDTTGIFKKVISFSDSTLVRLAAERMLSRFHDSIRNNGFNTVKNILDVYNEDIKPLKLPMLKFTNMIYHNETLYVSGAISLPITTEFERVRFMPSGYIFKFDKDFNYIDASEYQIDLDNKLTPVDIYGFSVSGIGEIKMPVVDFKSKVSQSTFIGKWELNAKKSYSFIDIDSTITMPVRDSLEFYYRKNMGSLMYKYRLIGDSLLAFNYYPFVLNTNTHVSYPLIKNCLGIDCPFYLSEWSGVIKQSNKNYYISIERYYNVAFLTVYNSSYDRLTSIRLADDLQKCKLFFMKDYYTLEAISFDDDGTISHDINVRRVLNKL